MALSITPEEVREQEEAFDRFIPPEPTLEVLRAAPVVETIAFTGTEYGMLLQVNFAESGRRNLFINPTVAVVLVEGIAEAGKVHGWWAGLADASISMAPDLTRDDLKTAEHVRSVRTANAPDGMLACFGSEQGTAMFFLRPNYAAAIAYAVEEIAKRAEWWEAVGSQEPVIMH